MKKLTILPASIAALVAAAVLWRPPDPLPEPGGQAASERAALERTVRRTSGMPSGFLKMRMAMGGSITYRCS